MNKKGFVSMLGCALAFSLSSCGQSIVKRWQVAGRLVDGRLTPHKYKSMDYEFTSRGKFNFYENGAITQTGNYTVASDKKSVLLKDGGNTLSGNIIKLTAAELDIRFKGSSDTIICYAYGSALSSKAQSNAEAYRSAKKYWSLLYWSYFSRASFMKSIIESINIDERNDNAAFVPLIKLWSEMQTYGDDVTNMTKAKYKQFENIQVQITTGLDDLLEYVKVDHADMKATSLRGDTALMSNEMVRRISRYDADIKKQKVDFIKAFNQYAQ